jgi:N-methylhydantoinase B/oxoprolinase/acetone carboxylase alpha subunit
VMLGALAQAAPAKVAAVSQGTMKNITIKAFCECKHGFSMGSCSS